jgi:hypothetical protein
MKTGRQFYRSIGNMHGYYVDQHGIPLILIGPDCNNHPGPYFVCMFTTLLVVGLTMSFVVSASASGWMRAATVSSVLICLSNYAAAALKDLWSSLQAT